MPNLKKTTFGVSVFDLRHRFLMVVGVILIAACSRQVGADTSKRLEGTWNLKGTNFNGGVYQSTLVVGTNGLYIAKISTHYPSDRSVRNDRVSGSIQIKQGMVIDTVTKHSNTNAVLPWISRGRIIRFDDGELVVEWEGSNRGELPSTSHFLKMK